MELSPPLSPPSSSSTSHSTHDDPFEDRSAPQSRSSSHGTGRGSRPPTVMFRPSHTSGVGGGQEHRTSYEEGTIRPGRRSRRPSRSSFDVVEPDSARGGGECATGGVGAALLGEEVRDVVSGPGLLDARRVDDLLRG